MVRSVRKWWWLVGLTVFLVLQTPDAQGIPCANSLSIHAIQKYRFNPAFEQEGAFERFTRFSAPPLARDAHRKRLDQAEEVEWFLRYNFLKYRAQQLMNESQNHSQAESLISEAETLLELALRVRQFLQIQNQGLIGSAVKKFKIRTVSPEELISEGQPTLIKAIDAFDVSYGFKFSTYASRSLIRIFSRFNKNTSKRLSREHEVVERLETASSVIDTAVEGERAEAYYDDRQKDIEETIAMLLTILNAREREVIEWRYGFDGREPKTLKELGAHFGLSRERIRQIEATALQRMREHAKLNGIEFE